MTVTVFIRYQLDPYRRTMFEEYARRWLSIIPKCGGDLIGYWMPHEGTTLASHQEEKEESDADHIG